MSDLVTLFLWTAGIFGLINILVVSRLMLPLRVFLTYKGGKIVRADEFTEYIEGTPRKYLFLSKLIQCPMCLGFWFGLFSGFYFYSPTEQVIYAVKSPHYVNYVFDGFIGSCLSWIMYLMIESKQRNLPNPNQKPAPTSQPCGNCTQQPLAQ